MVNRADEQASVEVSSERLCAVVALPRARLAFCGTSNGSVLTVECADATELGERLESDRVRMNAERERRGLDPR